MARIEILDTTLRDGAQAAGVTFSLEDKLRLLRVLDGLGVDYIEAGNPASNPKDAELLTYAARHMRLKNARLTAFGATCRAGVAANEDEGLKALAQSGARVVSLFGKASPFHVTEVLRTTLEENLRMIGDSVAFLADQGIEVLFDAEHFFDGYGLDAEYAMAVLRKAREAGARLVTLCDTNGGTLPGRVYEVTRAVCELLGAQDGGARVGIHCHNDSDTATAATLAAIEAGATHAQGTINGYGERCGNANLCAVLPGIVLKLGMDCLIPGALANLAPVARQVAEIANLPMYERMPYVGGNAFAHKGGMHIDAILKHSASFEHVSPECVGNARELLLSEMAGRGALMTRLSLIAPEITKDSDQTRLLMERLKAMESKGYAYEDAADSLRLMLLSLLGKRRQFFEVLDFHVVCQKPESDLSAQAMVKVRVDGREEITADEGDGPVNALDKALRKALTVFFPCLSAMRLTDFKVRVVDAGGTASAVRVRIDSSDGKRRWSTVGVSTNVIEASFIALTDSIECLLMDATDAAAQGDGVREGHD